jgi:hypothetical protein
MSQRAVEDGSKVGRLKKQLQEALSAVTGTTGAAPVPLTQLAPDAAGGGPQLLLGSRKGKPFRTNGDSRVWWVQLRNLQCLQSSSRAQLKLPRCLYEAAAKAAAAAADGSAGGVDNSTPAAADAAASDCEPSEAARPIHMLVQLFMPEALQHLAPLVIPAATAAAAAAAAGGQLPGVSHPMVQVLSCQGQLSPGGSTSAFLRGQDLEQLRPWAVWYLVRAAVTIRQVSVVESFCLHWDTQQGEVAACHWLLFLCM